MDLKICEILKTGEDYRLSSNSFTTMGVAIASAPFFRLSLNSDAEDVWGKIKEALNANTEDVLHPIDFKATTESYVSGLEFSSLKELHKMSRCCIVQMSDHTISFTPTKNEIGKSRFSHLAKLKESISIDSPSDKLIDTLNEVFTRCA